MTRAAVKSFVVCDDMRVENSGKALLIGVYANTIIFRQPFPVSYPKLLFVFRMDAPRVSNTTVTLRLTAPNKQKIFSTDMSVGEAQVDSDHMLVFTWHNPVFETAGVYTASLLIDGKKSFTDYIKVKTTNP